MTRRSRFYKLLALLVVLGLIVGPATTHAEGPCEPTEPCDMPQGDATLIYGTVGAVVGMAIVIGLYGPDIAGWVAGAIDDIGDWFGGGDNGDEDRSEPSAPTPEQINRAQSDHGRRSGSAAANSDQLSPEQLSSELPPPQNPTPPSAPGAAAIDRPVRQGSADVRADGESFLSNAGLDQGSTEANTDPVALRRGTFVHRAIDHVVQGLVPGLTFARAYRSDTNFDGPLGPAWDHNFDVRIHSATNPDVCAEEVSVSLGDLNSVAMRPEDASADSQGSYETRSTVYRPLDRGLNLVLTRYPASSIPSDCAWELALPDASTYCFDQDRLATRLTSPNGNDLQILWETYRAQHTGEERPRVRRVNRRLAGTITHILVFEYEASGAQRLQWTRLYEGEGEISAVEYLYNEDGELHLVRDAEHTRERYTYADVAEPTRQVPLEGLREFCSTACSDTVPAGCGGTTVCERAAQSQAQFCPISCADQCVTACNAAADGRAPREQADCTRTGASESECAEALAPLRNTFFLSCYASCQPQCTARCGDPNALRGACSGTCFDSCMAQATDPERVVYGSRWDLLHNLESITDAEDNLIVHNEYGDDQSRPDFDAVVHQRVGSRAAQPISLRYFDLTPPSPTGSEPTPVPADLSFPDIVAGEQPSSDVPQAAVAQHAPTGSLRLCETAAEAAHYRTTVLPFANGRGLYAMRPFASAPFSSATGAPRAGSTLVFEVIEGGLLRPRSPAPDLAGRLVRINGLQGALSSQGDGTVRLDGMVATQQLDASVFFGRSAVGNNALAPEQLYALHSSDGVQLGDRTIVHGPSGYGSVASAGALGVQLGTDVQLGDVMSGGLVEARDRSIVHGGVLSSGEVRLGNGARVEGSMVSRGTVPLRAPRLEVSYPSMSGDVTVEPSGRQLTPGAYRHVLVRPNARLSLSAGTYYFETLTVESNAVLDHSQNTGPVSVFVRSRVTFRGRIEDAGRADQLLLGYTGTEPIGIVEAPFRGTVLAPNATVRLQANGDHHGAFLGRRVETQGGTVIRHVPFAGSWPSSAAPSVWWRDDERRLGRPAEFKIPMTLAVAAGSASNHWVQITFGLGESTSVRCEWAGGSSLSHPPDGEQAALGMFYRFRRCSNGSRSGQYIQADRVRLHVATADFADEGGETRVQIRLVGRLPEEVTRAPLPALTGAQPGELVAFSELGQRLEPVGVLTGMAALVEGSCRTGFELESAAPRTVRISPPTACDQKLRLIPLANFGAESAWAGLAGSDSIVDLNEVGSLTPNTRRVQRLSGGSLRPSDWSQALSVLHSGGFDFLNVGSAWAPLTTLRVPRTASDLETTLNRIEEVAERAPEAQRNQILADIAQLRLDILEDLMSRGDSESDDTAAGAAPLPERREMKPALDGLLRQVRMPETAWSPAGMGSDCTPTRPLAEPFYAPEAMSVARARWATVVSGPDREPLISYYNQSGDNIRVVNTRRGIVDDMEYDDRHSIVGRLKHSADSLEASEPRVCATYDERGLPSTITMAATDGSGNVTV